MADLIPFMMRRIGPEEVNTVNADDLYDTLELTSDKSTWITRALKRAHMVKDGDYVVFHKNVENPRGGRPQHEYHLTFDAAAHVAMMSGSTKGHEVRTWFLAKAKELDALQRHPHASQVKNPAHQMLIEAIVRLDAVEQQAERAQQDAAAAQARAAQAEAKAEHAEASAQRAYEDRDFFTVAEYMQFEGLQQKIPQREYKALSDHLQAYCMNKGIPFRDILVGGKPWAKEHGYHRSVYVEVLPRWLHQRYGQENLTILYPPDAGRQP